MIDSREPGSLKGLLVRTFTMCVLHDSRLLGTLSVSLQEVVSRGSQSLSSALKSKKGDIMQVSRPMDEGECG